MRVHGNIADNLFIVDIWIVKKQRSLFSEQVGVRAKVRRKGFHVFVMLACVFTLSACTHHSPVTKSPLSSHSEGSLPLGSNAVAEKNTGNVNNELDIYVLIGQSNMAGRAPIPDAHKAPLDGVFVLNKLGKWVAAKHPLNLYSTIRKNEGMQKAGPGINFAKHMRQAQPNKKIGLVVNARGGSTIAEWCRNCEYYKQVLTRLIYIENKDSIKGVLWLQGESDQAKPAGYIDKLKQLVVDLRRDLAKENLPFIAAQVNNIPLINKQIAALPTVLDNTAVVYSNDLTAIDALHYDFASIQAIGERFAIEMQRLNGE